MGEVHQSGGSHVQESRRYCSARPFGRHGHQRCRLRRLRHKGRCYFGSRVIPRTHCPKKQGLPDGCGPVFFMGMEITLFCVGKLDKVWAPLANEYIKRIEYFSKIKVIEIPEPAGRYRNSDESVAVTSRQLAEKIGPAPWILLDRTGASCTSEEFSKMMMRELENHPGRLNLVIGASDGVSPDLQQGAKHRISFSALTFPHQLFRVILLEQVYRAFAIARNFPYHK